MLAHFVQLLPLAAAFVAASAEASSLPHHGALHARSASSSSARDPLDYLFPGTDAVSSIVDMAAGQHTPSSTSSSVAAPQRTGSSSHQDLSLGSLLGGLMGSIPGSNNIPSPNMSKYDHRTPEPRWGAAAQYLNGLQAIVFTGGQLDDTGRLSNETLLLDVTGLTNLQSTRASVNATPWLRHHERTSSVPAPKTAYAASRVSTSVCGATDGHLADTLWLMGGKTENCADQAVLYTYTLERHNDTIVGTWHDIQTNGTKLTRRAHAHAAFTGVNFKGGHDLSMIVLGGQDWDKECHPDKHDRSTSASSLDQIQIGDVMDQQCTMPKKMKHAGVEAYAYEASLDQVPVIDYAATSMPVIRNSKTKHTEEPYLLIGGRTKDRKLASMKHLWALDLASGNWSRWVTSGDIPEPRVGHSAVHASDGKVYVYGGYKKHGTHGHSVSKEPTDEMYVLDASQTPAMWSKGQYKEPPRDGPRPSKRAYHSAVMVNDILVVAFGQQHQSTPFGLEKRGGVNRDASEPMIMYMETRDNVMGFRWTDKMSAIVSGRVTQQLMGHSREAATAQYTSDSTASQKEARPSPRPLANMSRLPTPKESRSLASVKSKSKSRASVSRASAASRASVSIASAEASRAAQAHHHHHHHDQSHDQGHSDGPNPGTSPDQGQSQGQTGHDQDSQHDSSAHDDQPAQDAHQNEQKSQSSNSSPGAIAGGVLGACALAVGAVVGGLYAYRKRRESQKIAELRSNGVLRDDPESAPPVSSLWLQRPLREVLESPESGLGSSSVQGHAGTPLSVASAGGRSIGTDERHEVRGPRSAYESAGSAMPASYSAAQSYAPQEHGMFDNYLATYDGEMPNPYPAVPSQDSHYSYPYLGGVQRSSGAEVTTTDAAADPFSSAAEARDLYTGDDIESVYTNTIDGKTMVHGDENDMHSDDGLYGVSTPRRSASFRFPEHQATHWYAPHDASSLRVTNHS